MTRKIAEKKIKFKDEYVVAEGYPYSLGFNPFNSISVSSTRMGLNLKLIKFPKELWDQNVPKYQIVLRKVKP